MYCESEYGEGSISIKPKKLALLGVLYINVGPRVIGGTGGSTEYVDVTCRLILLGVKAAVEPGIKAWNSFENSSKSLLNATACWNAALVAALDPTPMGSVSIKSSTVVL